MFTLNNPDEIVVMKLGGGLIAPKPKEYTPEYRPTINKFAVDSVCSGLARSYYGDISVDERAAFWNYKTGYAAVLGAGGFGHWIVNKYGLGGEVKSVDWKNVERVNNTQEDLRNRIYRIMRSSKYDNRIHVQKFDPFSMIKMGDGEIKRFDSENIVESVKNGNVPLTYGVMAFSRINGNGGRYEIASGDDITLLTAERMRERFEVPVRAVMFTDVDGVLRWEGQENDVDIYGDIIRTIDQNNFYDVLPNLKGSKGKDFTGGMVKKITKVMASSIPTLIVNGNDTKKVENALTMKYPISMNDLPGTLLYPGKNPSLVWNSYFTDYKPETDL